MTTTIHINIAVQSLDELREELLRQFGPLFPVAPLSSEAHPLPAPVLSGSATPADAPIADTYVSDVKPEPEAPAEAEKPKRTRKAKDAPAGEPAGASAPPTAAPSDPAPGAPPAEAASPDAPMTAAQAEEARAPDAVPAKAVVATLSAGPNTLEFTREEVIDAARAFIAGHKDGKERGNAVVKGIVASMGFPRVSELPDDRMQEFLTLLDGA